MIKWDSVKLKGEKADQLLKEVKSNEGKNPGCKLIKYWSERMTPKMLKEVKTKKKLPYGFVGDGWPQCAAQEKALNQDKHNLQKAFHSSDLNCRDVGDAIYQANLGIIHTGNKPSMKVLDIGSGYGRLAVPFLHHYGKNIKYVGLDYSPIGLMCASEFVKEATKARVMPWYSKAKSFNNYDFISLPAWKIDMLKKHKFDLFVSIHSMQEMTKSAINYYVDLIDELAAPGALFYSINLEPANKVSKPSWELLLDRAYPINRDGNYNHRLWKIK